MRKIVKAHPSNNESLVFATTFLSVENCRDLFTNKARLYPYENMSLFILCYQIFLFFFLFSSCLIHLMFRAIHKRHWKLQTLNNCTFHHELLLRQFRSSMPVVYTGDRGAMNFLIFVIFCQWVIVELFFSWLQSYENSFTIGGHWRVSFRVYHFFLV